MLLGGTGSRATTAGDLEAEGRKVRAQNAKSIGFFGTDAITYQDLRAGVEFGELVETMLPCDCTE